MHVTDPVRYDQIARLFHWLAAIVLITAFALGIAMGQIGQSPLQDRLFNLHRAFGITVLGVVVLRFAWRLTHPVPVLPATIGPVQTFAAKTTHWLLYALLIAQPMLGWLGESGFGSQVGVFGLFTLPTIIPKDEALAKVLFGIHEWVAWSILALASLHVAAAIYHQVRGDRLLQRMWW
jgi:cytochrome b561